VTVPFARMVNEQDRRLDPLLEHAPDQIASRPLATLRVTVAPPANEAEPVVPTLTLMPEGFDVTRSPLRPDAVTVSVYGPPDGGGGGGLDPPLTVSAPNRNELLTPADNCTVVVSAGNVVIVNVALVAPAGTVTLDGTVATFGRLLPRLTRVPPAGAAADSLTVPVAEVPPVTLVGLTVKEDRLGEAAPDGFTVSVALCVAPPLLVEIVTGVEVATAVVVIWKLTLVMPARR
jgi:hypothetical protein